MRILLGLAGGAALLLPVSALAQTTGEAKERYDRAALAEMGATTAEDLIRRIPGGSQILDANNGGGGGGFNQRGFGAGGAQILIDGRRMAGKSNDMGAALRRIDARQVDGIELIRSSAEGLDVASEGIVINLLLAKGAASKGQGTIEVNARFTDFGRLQVDGLLSYAGKAGDVEYQASFERGLRAPPVFGQARWTDRFRDERYYFPDGTLQELRPQNWSRDQDKYTWTANLTWAPDAVSQLRLNGLYEHFRAGERAETPLTRFDATGVVTLSALETLNRSNGPRYGLEIGGDYEHKIGAGDFKLLFIVSRRDQHSIDVRDRLTGATLAELSRTDIYQNTAEDIVRLSYGFPAFGYRLELGGEAANNQLEQITQLFGDTNADGKVDSIVLPEAQARVKELRGEAYAKLNGKLGSSLTFETSLTAEYSRITTTYALYPPRSYLFLKPRIDLRYDLDARTQLGLIIERDVDQLDFGNFVPSYDGLSDRLLAGNPGIAPEHSWIAELRGEHRLAQDRGSLELKLFYERIDNEIDKMVIGLDSAGKPISASGNLGKATAYGVEGKFNFRLDALGIKGGILSGRAKRQITHVRDPFTGLDRQKRGPTPFELDLNFRHDVTSLALSYGAEFRYNGGNQVFSDIYVRELFSSGPRLDVFVQKKLGRFTLRFEGQQIVGGEEHRARTLFSDTQTIGTVLRREAFDEFRDRRFTFKVRTSF